ncbi:MAG: polymerase protein [Parcubacteria group bacterium GW2011_GWC1_41_7]|nr:MAG: polymerase protein [Parcubacteria group bacterium GW2011_GWC1_41_7]
MDTKQRTIILDTHALIHRLFHALPVLSNKAGQPTNAVYGVTNILLKILHEYDPKHIFACFDRPETTERKKIYDAYKATRAPVSDDLKSQFPIVHSLMQKFNIPILEKPGYEADDLIGSLVAQLPKNEKIMIVTGDFDTAQLVEGERVQLLILKKGISEVAVYDEKAVQERFGVGPQYVADIKALQGDASDNIIGLPGVGPKKAANVVQQLGHIENIIAHVDDIADKKIQEAVKGSSDTLRLNKELTTIATDIHVDIPKGEYRGYDSAILISFLQDLGFSSIVERLKKKNTESFQKNSMHVEKEIYEYSSNIETFQKSLNQVVRLSICMDGDHIMVFSDALYELPKTKKYAQEILALQKSLCVYDAKELLKCAEERTHTADDYPLLFDAKIAFALIHSNRYRASIADVVFEYTDIQANSDEEAQAFFLIHAAHIQKKLEENIGELNVTQVYDIEKKVIPALARMEQNGMWFDTASLEIFKKMVQKKLEALQKRIYARTGEFNISSPAQLREILFEKLKISPKGMRKTPKGEISTQEEELGKIENAHPVVKDVLEFRKLNKVLTTYTDSLISSVNPKTGRIQTHVEQIGTATGRISSLEPNLQNIPITGDLAREIRACFRAEDGYMFLGTDYSQIELRLTAHLSQDENLMTAFQAGLDIHSTTARLLFGSDEMEQRNKAKAVNFSIMYGTTASGLKDRLKISHRAAQEMIDAYFQKFPGVKKLIDELIERAKQKGYTETLFGRKRLIPEIHSTSFREVARARRMAINAPIQGLNADIIKKAIFEIDKRFIEKKWYPESARIALQVYDELIFEVKEDIIKEVEQEVRAIMEQIMVLSVPLKVNTHIGKTLADLK